MQTVFEKIIEKLEEQKSGLTEWAEDEAFKFATDKAIEIVKHGQRKGSHISRRESEKQCQK